MVPLTTGDRMGNLYEKGDCSWDAHSPLVHLMGSGRKFPGSRHSCSEIHLLLLRGITSFPIGPSYLSTGTFATSGGRGWIFQAKSILGVFLPSADKAADTQSFIVGRSQYCWSAHHQRSQHTLCQPWPLGLQVQGQNGDGKSPSLITCRKSYWINEII